MTVTLDAICSKKCDSGLIQTYLSGFLEACGKETQAKDQLLEIYDVLYTLTPFQNALCSKDSASQKYCAVEITVPPASTAGSGKLTSSQASFDPIEYASTHLITVVNVAQAAAKRVVNMVSRQQASLATVVKPNADTYKKTNLPFLFLSPTWDAKSLCTPCSSSVMRTYSQWIFQNAYYGQPAGINTSPLLGGFTELYQALSKTCTPAFMANVNGGNEGVTGAAAVRAPVASAAVLAVAGVVALVMV